MIVKMNCIETDKKTFFENLRRDINIEAADKYSKADEDDKIRFTKEELANEMYIGMLKRVEYCSVNDIIDFTYNGNTYTFIIENKGENFL